MAPVTVTSLLQALVMTCEQSALVQRIEARVVEEPVLAVRVYLQPPQTFLNVFYNVAFGKASFALVVNEQRIYGADNAKIGWHVHPFENPQLHVACDPMTFEAVWAAVEAHYTA